MTRLWWRARHLLMRRRALVDALEEAYADCNRYRRERDELADKTLGLRYRIGSAPRSVP